MTSIPQIAQVLQSVLTDTANRAARSTGFIQRQRAFDGAQFVQAIVGRGLRRLAARSVPEQQPAVPLPSWDDATLADSLTALANLTEDECREFLASCYRVVLAYERSGDVRVLTEVAREARTIAQLWARPDFREAARRPAHPVPPEATLSVAEVLAKLGG